MIIDAHVHLTPNGKWFNTKYDASIGRLLREMDKADVDRAVVIAIEGQIDNDFVAKVVSEHPDRFWGIGSVNPAIIDLAKKHCGEKNLIVGLEQ